MNDDLTAALTVELTADTEARTITGRIVTFGDVGRTSLGAARFDSADAISVPSDPSRVKLLRDHDTSQPVGYGLGFTADDGGLVATFKVPQTPEGDRALLEAAEHLRDGLSVGVRVTKHERADDGTLIVQASQLREASQVALPAYDDARVMHVAASDQTADQPTTENHNMENQTTDESAAEVTAAEPARPIQATELAQLQASTPELPEPPKSLGIDELTAMVAEVNRGNVDQADLQAALTDATTGSAPAFVRPQYVNDLVNLVERGRPLINRGSTRRQLPATGMAIDRPRWATLPTVGVQSTEKTEVTSSAVSIVLDRKNVVTIAGGNDVSVQVIERSSPSFMAELVRAYAEQYSRATESAVSTAMNDGTSGAGTLSPLADNDKEPAKIIAAFSEAVIQQGFSLDFMAFGPGTLQYMIAAQGLQGPAMFPAQASPRTGDGSLGGIDMFSAWALPANIIVGGTLEWFSFYESAGSPFQLRAVQAAKLGVDLSVFGMHALDQRYGRDNAMHVGAYKLDVSATPTGDQPGGVPVDPDECDDEGWPAKQSKSKAK